ncbi:unnamed protein product [Ilex paraguariensis]|uniref:Uncharacterized protein n=1 Tax=Ilex paraguariensis TaxID=185542 RepID=A0ABC8QMB2_9AQUA
MFHMDENSNFETQLQNSILVSFGQRERDDDDDVPAVSSTELWPVSPFRLDFEHSPFKLCLRLRNSTEKRERWKTQTEREREIEKEDWSEEVVGPRTIVTGAARNRVGAKNAQKS